jgi:predicted phage terminase large subunit-like protein
MLSASEMRIRFGKIASPACFAAGVSQGRWQPARHLEAIDAAVMDTVRHRSEPILVIEAPPRHGKSELISKYLPAWFLGTFPDKRVMLAAYGATFARSWGRKARELLEEFGRELFGVQVRDDLRSASEWGLWGSSGGMVVSGVGGPMTGRGADLLIIDDPLKNSEQSQSEIIRQSHWDWWQSTASTRLEPGGCVIVVATRWHEDDLSGRLIRAAIDCDGLPVRELRLPALAEEPDPLHRSEGVALWPDRWSVEMLEARRKAISLPWWLAQYQQRPGRGEGVAWGDEYFTPRIWADDWPDAFERAAVAIDPAGGKKTGDYAAIVFAGVSGGLLWVDALLVKKPAEQVVSDAIRHIPHWRPNVVGFESNNLQGLLGREFDRQCREMGCPPLPLVPIHNSADKTFRIQDIGPYLREQKIRFRDTEGSRLLVQQLREFPLGRHDDGPDALQMAIRLLRHHREWNLFEGEVVMQIARA